MFTVEKLLRPNSTKEAYDTLVSKKNNIVLGGCAFLRLSSRNISTAIDLSKLELDYIKDQKDYIEVGAYTTFRDIEIHPLFIENFNGVISKAVGNVIGIQFRNIVTIGASIFSKYGFSDLITALLALDTEVELYQAGRMSLEEFLKRPYEKDLLTRVFIKKDQRKAVYQDLRNSASDFPILNVAVSRLDNQWKIVVGARPQKAAIAVKASRKISNTLNVEDLEYCANIAAEELNFGTNTRATAKYRQEICKVLVKRAIKGV